jgi:predicted amidophosphoribosyltransferase
MNKELIELVEQLIEFGYGDPLKLDSISKRLRNEQLLYTSDQKYVDTLVSKYLYPHEEESGTRKRGSLENKIHDAKQRYVGETNPSTDSNLSDLCPKCGSPVPRMFSFCSKCGAFHDEHNFINTNENYQKKEDHDRYPQQSSQDASIKSCITCSSKIFKTHEFCPICGSYQGKNKLRDVKKFQSKQKRYAGIAVAGIIFIILGVISAVSLFQYSNLCSSIVGQLGQNSNLQALAACNYIQTLTNGVVFFIIGIILLVARAVKRRNRS